MSDIASTTVARQAAPAADKPRASARVSSADEAKKPSLPEQSKTAPSELTNTSSNNDALDPALSQEKSDAISNVLNQIKADDANIESEIQNFSSLAKQFSEPTNIDVPLERMTFAGIDMSNANEVLQRASAIKTALQASGNNSPEAQKRAREVSRIESEARESVLAEQLVVAARAAARAAEAAESTSDESETPEQTKPEIQVSRAGQLSSEESAALIQGEDAAETANLAASLATNVVNSEDESAKDNAETVARVANSLGQEDFAGVDLVVESLPYNELQNTLQRLLGSEEPSDITSFFAVA